MALGRAGEADSPALDIGSMMEVVAVDRKTGAITLSQTRDLRRRGMGRVVVGKELPWSANLPDVAGPGVAPGPRGL
ncbi:MAG TPA: hypothetical protein VFJ24_01595 [Gaiellales bacterium]|nr:hypothetical protein [Gaiellales bacterium]